MGLYRWLASAEKCLRTRLAHTYTVIILVLTTPRRLEDWYQQFGDIASTLHERDRALRQQRNRFSTLFENTNDCVAIVTFEDDEVRIRDANKRFERVFGSIGDDDARLSSEFLDTAAAGSSIRQQMRHGEHVSLECTAKTVNGERQFRVQFVPFSDADETLSLDGGCVVYTDITAEKGRQRELTRTRELLEQSQCLANVGAWELDLQGDTPTDLTWTDEVYRIHDLPVGEDVELERAAEFYHPEDRSRIQEAIEGVIEAGDSYDLEARLITASGDQRWVRTLGQPICEDGDIVSIRGMIQDITTRKQQERRLQSLHEATRELLHTDSEEAVCDLVVDIAEDILPGVAVHLLDSENYEFRPAAVSPTFVDLCGTRPSFDTGDDDSPAWQAFVRDETVMLDDVSDLPWPDQDDRREEPIYTTTRVKTIVSTTDEAIESGFFVPVGEYGLVTVLSTEEAIDSQTRQLIETLVSTMEAALDRLASEESIRQREIQLQARNEQLNRQMHLTDIIRSVNQSLVDVDSRAEIETAVCERLVESERISFAWVGTYDDADGTVQPSSSAGDGDQYLDSVALDDSTREPSWQTADTGTVTAVDNVVAELRTDGDRWRREALEAGFQSVISVPISHEGYDYGVLTVYAGSPDALNELEASVFSELGETIGKAINASQTRQALYSDTVNELKLQFTDTDSPLAEVSTATDCRVELDGLASQSSDRTQLFFSAHDADAESVLDVLDRAENVASHRAIERDGDSGHFSATVTEGLVGGTLVPNAARPTAMVAVDGTLDATVEVSPETDVRTFVEQLSQGCAEVELVGRRETERTVQTKLELVDALLEPLTDRQRETLTTAYYSGYFEWPRETTGEGVATMLGVSQPTVNRHLRFGQLKLLEQLFESSAPGECPSGGP
jgi:predicted DNA binding protein/PAS domain-containing protein